MPIGSWQALAVLRKLCGSYAIAPRTECPLSSYCVQSDDGEEWCVFRPRGRYHDPPLPSGLFVTWWEKQMLDLSVEALVLKSPFCSFSFPGGACEKRRERLEPSR